jgi:hypothetical protein
MGRTAIETPAQDKPAIDGELLARDMATQIASITAGHDNAVALAKQLNYEGALTVGGLEEEIKFYQRRSVEAVLETGKRLLLLKEITEHGGFMASLEGLGISQGLANKFMSATVKFSNSSTSTILTLPNINHSKLLELMVLDEGEIEALAEGNTVRGLKLDDVDCMSVSELRTALRKAKREQDEEAATRAEMLRRRDERINRLEEENARLTAEPKPPRTPAMEEEERLRFMTDHGLMLVREIEVGLRSHFALIDKLFPEGVRPNHVQLAQQQAVSQVIQAARVLAGDYGILLQQADIERPDLLWLTQSEQIFGATPEVMRDGPDHQADEA